MGKKRESKKNNDKAKPNDKHSPIKKSNAVPINKVLTIKTKLSDNNCAAFLLDKCTNKQCKDIHNYSLKYKKENNTEFSNRYINLCQDFVLLKPIQHKIFKQTTLDLMFIIDCTGSMSEWIKATKDELSTIIAYIQSNNPYSKVKVSFVGYRDHCDKRSLNKQKNAVPVIQPVIEGQKFIEYEMDYSFEPNHGEYTGRFDIIDFDEDIGKIKWFISGVKAFGGGDLPEDVAGGLKKGLEQSWSSPAKYCVFICDAPGHGKKYHNILGDTYPNGDPYGLVIEDLMIEYAKQNINFYFIQIDPKCTQKMIDIMSQSYQTIARKPIYVSNMGNSTNDFSFFVAFGASCALNSVTMNGMNIAEFLNDLKSEVNAENNNNNNPIELGNNNNNDNIVYSDNNPQMSEVIEQIPENTNNNIYNFNSTQQGNAFDFNANYVGSLTQPQNYQMNTFLNKIGTLIGNPYGEDFNNNEVNANLEIEINKMNAKQKDLLVADYTIPNEPIVNAIETDSTKHAVICYSYYISNQRNTKVDWTKPNIKSSEVPSTLLLSNKPFSEGAMRFAFYAKDIELNQSLVAKIPKSIAKEDYTIDNMAKDLESLVICHHISNDFNNRIIHHLPDTRLLLNFVNAWIYKIIEPETTFNLLYVENEIKGNYEKYNNNLGWISKNMSEIGLVAQCFSHFSWQISKGYLIIVDLQGVGGELTDPQVHCLNMTKYGKGNLGYVGMLKFFLSHSCNSYCKKLGLIHPQEAKDINEEFEFFVEEFKKPEDNRPINKICDLCYKPFLKGELDLYELRKRRWEAFCDDCDTQRKSSWIKKTCSNSQCKQLFTASKYYYKMKRKEFPSKCDQCRLEEEGDNEKMYIEDNDISPQGLLFG